MTRADLKTLAKEIIKKAEEYEAAQENGLELPPVENLISDISDIANTLEEAYPGTRREIWEEWAEENCINDEELARLWEDRFGTPIEEG